MKEFNATFDSVNDQPKKPVPGKYPSHVSGFEAVSLKSGGKVFNIDFTLADECKNMTEDNLGEESLAFMAGKQYRSAVFFHTPEQKKAAEEMKEKLNPLARKKFQKDIVTEIKSASDFYRAEEYHQQYLAKSS